MGKLKAKVKKSLAAAGVGAGVGAAVGGPAGAAIGATSAGVGSFIGQAIGDWQDASLDSLKATADLAKQKKWERKRGVPRPDFMGMDYQKRPDSK